LLEREREREREGEISNSCPGKRKNDAKHGWGAAMCEGTHVVLFLLENLMWDSKRIKMSAKKLSGDFTFK